jgi:hypothetical protein
MVKKEEMIAEGKIVKVTVDDSSISRVVEILQFCKTCCFTRLFLRSEMKEGSDFPYISYAVARRFSAVPGSTPNTLLWCRFSERYQIPYFAHNAVGLPRFADVSVGLSWSRILRRGHSHDLVPEFSEQSALEWLCRVVSNHVPRGTPNY